MVVLRHEWHVFYELLCKKFVEREHGNVLPGTAKNFYSQAIWEQEYKGGIYKSKRIAQVLFSGGRSDSEFYFWRLNGDFKSKPQAWVDDTSLFKALKYLEEDFTYEIVKELPTNLKRDVDILFQQFRSSNRSKIEDLSAEAQPPSFERFKDESNLKEPDVINQEFASVEAVIVGFYEDISVKDLDKAWERLSPNFRNRDAWKGSFKRFEEGYANTRGIRNIEVKNIHQSSKSFIDCDVSYRDEIEAGSSFELDSLSRMTVKDVDEFARILKKIRSDVERLGGTGFDKIELSTFLQPAASENIWFQCGFSPDVIANLFSNRTTVYVEREYTCTCYKIDNNWYIDRIRHFKAQ
ncbi:hypothetical protein [Spirosoma pulveris]